MILCPQKSVGFLFVGKIEQTGLAIVRWLLDEDENLVPYFVEITSVGGAP